MENPVFNEIKNWHLFTKKFGDEYTMHDASIKRFDLNEDELTVVFITFYTTMMIQSTMSSSSLLILTVLKRLLFKSVSVGTPSSVSSSMMAL